MAECAVCEHWHDEYREGRLKWPDIIEYGVHIALEHAIQAEVERGFIVEEDTDG